MADEIPTERLAEVRREFDDVQARLADPDVTGDRQRYEELARHLAALEPLARCAEQIEAERDDLAAARELLTVADAGERAALREEIETAEAALSGLRARFAELARPRDPDDDRNVIVEIRGAEGGEEANLFARDLFEMYRA